VTGVLLDELADRFGGWKKQRWMGVDWSLATSMAVKEARVRGYVSHVRRKRRVAWGCANSTAVGEAIASVVS
jgi:hypothetical protein